MKTLITILAVSIVMTGVLMWVIFPAQTKESDLEKIVKENIESLEKSNYAKYITGYQNE